MNPIVNPLILKYADKDTIANKARATKYSPLPESILIKNTSKFKGSI